MARGILLTGGVGTGKTTVLLALGELLEERGEPYALLDLDWLAWVRPAPGTMSVQDVLVANLAAAWETFSLAGVETLVLARYVRTPEELAAIRAALPEVDLVAVRLLADDETRERRLRLRDSGRELEEHLLILGSGEPPPFEDAEVANNGTPRETALEVLARATP